MSTTSRLAILTLLVASPLLGGCGGGDPEPGPTRGPAPSTPAPTTAGGDVDVCRLVPKALRAKAFPGGEPTTKLAYGSENVVVCGSPGTVSVEYGYVVADGATMPKVDGDQVTRLPGIGDRAVQEKGSGPPGKIVTATLWAQAHGITFYVRDDAILNSGGTAVSLDTAKAVLKALVARVAPADVEQTAPIVLGPHCPAADAPSVTAVTGTVVTARGGAEGAEEPECQYLGEGGTRVDLTVLVQDGVEKTFFNPSYQKKIPMSGVRSAWTDRDPVGPGAVSLSWTTAPDVLWMLGADPLQFGADARDDSGRATLATGMALGRAFMKANAGVGG